MAYKKIKEYWARWDLNDHFGRFWLRTEDSEVTIHTVKDPQEFSVIIDLLRNEEPVFYDDVQKHLTVGLEPVGEGE